MNAPQRSFGRLRIGVLAALALIALVELVIPNPAARQAPEGMTGALDPEMQIEMVDPSANAYNSIVTDYLFAENRTPSAAALARLNAAIPTLGVDGPRIVGIVTSGNTRIALLQRPGAPQPEQLHVGDALDGATVRNITPNDVIVSGANGTVRSLPVDHRSGQQPQSGESIGAMPSGDTAGGANFDQRQGQAVYENFMRTRQLGVTADNPSSPVKSGP